MTFQTLKKSRSNFSSLQKELEKIKSPETQNYNKNDERFWRPELDKVGNGYAVIRFLPAPKSQTVLTPPVNFAKMVSVCPPSFPPHPKAPIPKQV